MGLVRLTCGFGEELQIMSALPPRLRCLAGRAVRGLTGMQCMYLHETTLPSWRLETSDFSAYIAHCVLFGMLRSRDYSCWQEVFRRRFGREAFEAPHWHADLATWKWTYAVEYSRASDVTKEFSPCLSSGHCRRRNPVSVLI